MAKKLKYDLIVEANALLCPNAEDFYSKTYLTSDISDNVRTIPGVKSNDKLANIVFGQLMQAENRTFEDLEGSDLGAIDIGVCSISIMAEVCQFDIEKSFLSKQMQPGSNSDFSTMAFMTYYWETMAKKIGEERTLISWQGDTESVDPLLSLCDGWLKKLKADDTVIKIDNVASTPSNVIAELSKVVLALPKAIRQKMADVRIFVSSDIAINYLIATATTNTINNITMALSFTFLGMKMIAEAGMPDSTVVATNNMNLIYVFDGENDGEQLEAINLRKTVAEPKIRTRADLKMGFWHTNGAEIVLYGTDVEPVS